MVWILVLAAVVAVLLDAHMTRTLLRLRGAEKNPVRAFFINHSDPDVGTYGVGVVLSAILIHLYPRILDAWGAPGTAFVYFTIALAFGYISFRNWTRVKKWG